MAEGYSQDGHLLRIHTKLNQDAAEKKFEGDPLLLAKLDGVEGISQLFAYDIIMLRDAGGKEGETVNGHRRPPIDTTTLIGTHAELEARPTGGKEGETDDKAFRKRVGMFETFEDLLGLDITKIKTPNPIPGVPNAINFRDFHIYRARVVPWIKALNRDICYRVFEKKTVVQIIKAVIGEAKKTFPHLIVDTTSIEKAEPAFIPMDYCVQFGESTLNFLFRLMARFGIWYYFGHSPDGGSFDLLNETMFLMAPLDHKVSNVGFADVEIADEDPPFKSIGKLVRRFRPPERRVAVGGFNYLNPINPFYKTDTAADADDLLKLEGGPASETKFSGTTSFAQPVFSDAEVAALATVAKSANDSEVSLLSGITKNQTFIAGHNFHINKPPKFDENDDENLKAPFKDIVNKDFVIDALAISVNDYTYVTLRSGFKPLDLAVDALFHTVTALQADATDDTNNALYRVSLWATQTAQAKIYSAVNPLGGNFADTASGLDVDLAGLANSAAGLAGSIPVIGSLLSGADFKKAVSNDKNMASFAIGVIAVPLDSPFDPALPLASRPIARGPHTALVIGPDNGTGAELHGQDVYCDALGRVRIRFPWDPGPPPKSAPAAPGGPSKPPGDPIPPVFPFADPSKPTKVGGNTCWVRVSEGWAGRSYGMQFPPRIGQEVLVDFLDGDPERPVITGRLYNADRVITNQPYPDKTVQNTQITKITDLPNTARDDLPYSGIKTFSIPTTVVKPGDPPKVEPLPTRYHMMRFNDKRWEEQYLMRSQGRMDVTAFACHFDMTYGDRHIKVAQGTDQNGTKFGSNAFITVGGEYDLHVGGNRYEQVEKDYEITVKGTNRFQIKGDMLGVVDGKLNVGVSDNVTIESSTQITLKVGGSWIVIGPCGIYINAPMVYINSGGSPDSSLGVTMQNIADADTADPGEDYDYYKQHQCIKSGGGGRGTHSDQINPAPDCIAGPVGSNAISVNILTDLLGGGGSAAPGAGGGGAGGGNSPLGQLLGGGAAPGASGGGGGGGAGAGRVR